MPARAATFTVGPEEDRRRLDRFLAGRLPDLSRSAIQRLARGGLARVEGEPARPASKVRAGQVVSLLVPDAAPARLTPEAIPIEVLYEDDDLAVVVKPAGMVTHPGAGVRAGTLVHALLGRSPRWSTVGGEERPGIVHRLDRGTSGVMVVARTDRAHRGLAAQFKDRLVEKRYLALVWGRVAREAFTVSAPLGRDERLRRLVSTRTRRPRDARTSFEVVERFDGFTWIEARPLTGRTHQIRAHLKLSGHPIVGDAEYGGRRGKSLPAGAVREAIEALPRLALHASRIAFTHPAGGARLAFEAPIPADLAALLDLLRRGAPPRPAAGSRTQAPGRPP